MTEHKGCEKLFERISEFLDGEVDDKTGDEIRRHLEACPECRACYDGFRKSVEVFRRIGPETVSRDFLESLKKTIRETQ